MPYHSQYQSYPIPEDGEDQPPDGFNGALDTISDQENWGDIIQTFVRQLEHDTVKTGPIGQRPDTPDIDDDGQAFYCSTDEGDDNNAARLYIYDIDNGWRPITPPPGADNWVPSEWGYTDVSEHGFPGDESGGDLWAFIANNGPGEYHLPPGRYSIESELDFYQDLTWSMIKIVGHGDVTLVVNDNDAVDTLIRTADASSPLDYVHLENFDVEIDYGTQTGRDDPPNFDGADAGLWRISVNKRFIAKDIELVGRRAYHSLRDWYEQDTANRTDYSGEIYNSRVNMLEKDANAIIENVRHPDGGEGSDRPRVIPFSVEVDNVGTQIYKQCHGAGWQGNTYYVKDGTGTSVLWNCTAGNGGAQMFRYGQQDLSIGGQTWTDSGLDNLDHTAGTHLDVHLGEGTGVFGHRVYDTRGVSELVRARSGNKQATVRDVYIYSTGTNACIRTSSTSSGDNSVSEHGDGHLVFDNVRIEIESADTSATKLGAIENRRANTVYRNVSTWLDVPDTGYASVNFRYGDASFENCKFGMSDTNNAGYCVIGGPNDSTEDRIGRLQFDKCVFEGTVYHYSGDQIPFLSYTACDFTALGGSTPWGVADPHNMFDSGDIDDFLFIGNAPFTSDSSYGYLTQNRITVADMTVENNLDMTSGILDNLGNIRGPNNDNVIFNLIGTTSNNRFTVYDNAGSAQVFNVYQDGNVEVPTGALSVNNDASANAFSASSNGSSGGFAVGGVINYSEFSDAARIYNSATSPSWAMRYDGSSGWTNAFEIRPEGYGNPGGPTDLAGTTGNFDGEVRVDDGTNTPARGTQCVWDDVNAVWRPQHDPTQSFV